MAQPSRVAATLLAAATIAGAGLVAPSPAEAQTSDACTTFPPTFFDQQPGWECVGLVGDASVGPVDSMDNPDQQPGPTDSDVAEMAVALTSDGRLYRQIAPTPAGPTETPSVPDEPELPGFAGGVQESVFPPDDRFIERATTFYPGLVMTAILRRGERTSHCSGALIGPRHVLTAGHCLHRGSGGDQGWFRNLAVAPGMDGIGQFPNGLKTPTSYISTNEWVHGGNQQYDYGMIVLEDRIETADLGWLGLRPPAPSGEMWQYGYPGYYFDCAASPLPNRECGNFLYGDYDGYVNYWTEPLVLFHWADTNEGQSGGPIFENRPGAGGRQVIGVHTRGGGEYNTGTAITPDRLDDLCDWIRRSPSAYRTHACQ